MSKQRWREAIEGYLFLLPNLLGFLVFMAVPLGMSLYYSFTDYDLLTPAKFVGLKNYVDALGFSVEPEAYQAALAEGESWLEAAKSVVVAHDATFWIALRNTALYAVGVLVLAIIPSFLVAWLLNSKLRGMTFFRAMFYIPVVASIVGVALVWFWIYKQQSGVLNSVITAVVQLLNTILGPLGVTVRDPNIPWLVDSRTALLSLFVMTSWATIGYDMVIFLAALQGIPQSLFEAALVDGSSRLHTLRRIVIPLLSPTIFFVLVTNTITILQVFSEPYIMTQGGPANSTMTIVLYLYRMGFQRFRMGYAASLAWIVFAIIFLITTIQFRLGKRWVYEE
ncbi:MAG: sugar ABC transporter permease [Anaerolineae bacterium]|nr:sugar ABC transporter permease [Anaerolineae bacterium]